MVKTSLDILESLNMEKNPSDKKHEELVLERITIDGIFYYRDKYKKIFDKNAELVGVWEFKNGFQYYIFSKENEKIEKIKSSPFMKVGIH